MAKRPLTPAQVDALKKHGTHWVAPLGLYLQVKPNGARRGCSDIRSAAGSTGRVSARPAT